MVQPSTSAPPGAIHSHDAPDLARLFEPGEVLSCYLPTPSAIPNASQQAQVRWNNVRVELAEQGVPAAALDAIDTVVPDAHRDGETLAVFADASGVRHVEHGAEPVPREVARWAPLPSIGLLLAWRQEEVPHLLVLTDRTGADLVVVTAARGHQREDRDTVEPATTDPIRKVAPGGWSQRRYQERAENTWRDNAASVADRVTALVDEHGARVVIVAGDVRAVELLQGALPKRVQALVRVVEGGRAAGATIDEHTKDVVHLVATAAAEQTVALLHKFDEEIGQADRAVNGPAATLAALAQAQVDVLLVHDDPDDTRQAWIGPKPLDVAANETDLRDLGIDDVRPARLVDVMVRAAFASDAGVRMVPRAGPLRDGAGALLRWSS